MLCLLIDGNASLLLSQVRRDSEGNLAFGFVKNGCWNFQIKNGEVLAKDGNYIVNRYDLPNYYELEIPKDVDGNYNEVMAWAEKEYARLMNKEDV